MASMVDVLAEAILNAEPRTPREMARATLRMLMEPTAEMIAAGGKRQRQHGTPRQVFRAMIEKGLEET